MEAMLMNGIMPTAFGLIILWAVFLLMRIPLKNHGYWKEVPFTLEFVLALMGGLIGVMFTALGVDYLLGVSS